MKKIFSFLLTLVITNMLWAYDFQSGGLYYNITSNLAPYTVEVTYGTYHSLTTATIPKTVIYKGNTYSVTSIGEDAFYGNSILVSATIPNSVTSIGNSAFGHCSSLTSVTIPNSVTSIGSSTFSGCSSLTSITIPNSVTSIGGAAFYDCSSLTSITIPNSVTSIGSSAFYGCIFTKDSFVNNSTLNAGANNYWGAELADEEIDGLLIRNDTVIYCRPNVISVTIPNSVTSIGEYAFGGCSSLTSISIPNSVTSIGGAAFYDCSALTSIIIPNNVTSIEYYTFYGCKSLSSITLPNNITNIGEAAFHDCSSLTSIIIPNNVRNIGESVFYNCSSLKSVIIPNNVTNIGDSAFYNCSSITSCTIGNRVKSIGVKAFYNCSNLNSITFPNSVETIDNGAFEGCTSLKVIEIGRNLKSIDDFAFYYYWRNIVEEITVRATTPPNLGTTVFQTNSDIIAKVPCSKLKTYQQDSDWKNFKLEGFGGDCSCTAVPYEITCKEAAEIAYFLPSTTHTDEPYTVIGYVTDIDAYSVQSKEKQTFWMADNPNGGNVFKCYCGKAIDDSYDTRTVKIGDKVSVTGQLTRFGSDCRIEYGDVDILANGDRLQIYTVSVASNNASMGTVSGDGEYERGAIATVIATANNGYKFTKWSDGTTINPYTFTVTEDICLTATFVKDEITCEEAATIAAGLEHNTPTEKTYTVIGYVTEAYGVGSNNQQTFWMADTPNGGNVFQSYWGNVTEAVAVGDKVSLTGQIMRYNSTYEIKNGAVVILTKADDVQTYTVTASSANTSMGTVSGGGEYEDGTTATVTATPKSGYKFTKWSDGTTKNPYTFTVTKDVSLIAYFEKESSSEAYEITCEEAAEIAASLPHNTPTAETYTVIGYVTETDGVISRNQQRFWMADYPDDENVFQCYWGNVTEVMNVGDKVAITGQIMRYNSTYQIKNGDVVRLSSEEVISCEEAVEFVNTYLQNNESSASIYNVVGYVTETDGVISRGQQRFWMDDIQGGSKVFQCYWGNVSETIKVGDYVSVRGHLMRYNSTAQIKNGDVTVLSYGTGVDDVVIHKTFDKIIHNGQLLILRDGKTYNAMGQEM